MNSRTLFGNSVFFLILVVSLCIPAANVGAVEIINLTRWEAADGGNDHWYAIMNTEMSWTVADTTIGKVVNAGKPGHLVTITSAEENQFITDQVIGSLTPSTPLNQFWTAGYDMESFWMWRNSESFSYFNWDDGEPGDAFVSHVITLTGGTGLWRAEPPFTFPDELMLWSVVEWEPAGEGDIELINLTEWRGHWYAVIPAELYWEEADSAASTYYNSAKRGYLATVQSQAENDFILNSVIAGTDQPSIEDMFWIGGKMVDEQWTWITSEMFPFENWSPGEPNNFPVGTAMGMWGPNNTSIFSPNKIPGKWNDALPNDSIHSLHRYWAVVEWGDPHPALPVNVTYWPVKDGGNNHWYGLLGTEKNWQEARDRAETFINHGEQGYLATVANADENEFILSSIIKEKHLPGFKNQYWLGGEYSDGEWGWITREAFNYLNWAPGEPNNIGVETALGMWGPDTDDIYTHPDSGTWNNSIPDHTLSQLHRYYSVVEWGEPLSDPMINLTKWASEDGGNDHWYAVIPQELFWEQSDSVAKSLFRSEEQGYLATVTSQPENNFILENIITGTNQQSILDLFWLGGKLVDEQWLWITDEYYSFENWSPGEPNNLPVEAAMCMWGPNNIGDPRRIPGQWNNALPNDSINALHRYWAVVEWGEPELVPVVIPTNEWINIYCDWPLLDGEHLPPVTVIDAYDPDGVRCGSAVVEPDGKYGFMPIYRDDIYTDFDEGAEPGDLISFRINGQPVTTDPEVIWDVNGSSFSVCLFSTATCNEISLGEGWNLISWNKNFTTDVESLIGDFKDKVDRILGFDNGGLTYIPGLEKFSSLEQMDFYSGYWFKMNALVTFEICGANIPVVSSIPISPGWNLVSYWPDDPLAVESAIESIIENTTVAYTFDNGAKTWLPGQGTLNTLTDMTPGLGYWLYSTVTSVLIYPGFGPAPASQAAPLALQTTAKTAAPKAVSRVWISAYGESIKLDKTVLPDGSIIEFVTADGVHCGSSIYSGGVLKFTPVYGRDAANRSTNLLPVAGDEVMIVVNGNPVEQTIHFGHHGELARINDLTSKTAADLLPDKFALNQNFPNPFNPTTEISFVLPNASDIQLIIYNVLGQEIATIASGVYGAGYHQIQWSSLDNSGNQVSSGIYFYRLTTDQFVEQKKMVLLK